MNAVKKKYFLVYNYANDSIRKINSYVLIKKNQSCVESVGN